MGCSEDGAADSFPPPPDLSPPPPTPPPALSLPMDSDSPAPPSQLERGNSLEPLQHLPSVEESSPAPSVVLADDLRDKIVRQVEYYFSDENLPTDEFLLKHVKRNKQGFVPIGLIASFRKMKKLVQDNSVVADALRTSEKLVVSADGKKVKRRVPLPDEDDVKGRSVLVKNIPENQSIDDIRKIFETVGSIKNISISGSHQIGERSQIVPERVQINRKMEALVEYETMDAANSAVDSLNDRNDWRNGLRVELVNKTGKQGAAQRKPKKTNTALEGHANLTDNSRLIIEHEVENVLQEKNEEWTRRKHKGRGHGSVSLGAGAIPLNRLPPGPRMPDGTRGFTMGRGRHIVQNQIEKSSTTSEGCFEMTQ